MQQKCNVCGTTFEGEHAPGGEQCRIIKELAMLLEDSREHRDLDTAKLIAQKNLLKRLEDRIAARDAAAEPKKEPEACGYGCGGVWGWYDGAVYEHGEGCPACDLMED